MVAVLTHVIGIKEAIVAMTSALILSHISRVIIYWKNTSSALAVKVLLFGTPTLILGAVIFGHLNSDIIATIFVIFLVLSFPIKYWARNHQMQTSQAVLSGASMVWGMLAGNVIGAAFFLAPFLLGTGINRLTFVGTLAIVTLFMNVIKLSVFGITELMTWPLFMLGVIIGAIAIPGNWVGRKILLLLGDRDHRLMVDLLTLGAIVNFIWVALRS